MKTFSTTVAASLKTYVLLIAAVFLCSSSALPLDIVQYEAPDAFLQAAKPPRARFGKDEEDRFGRGNSSEGSGSASLKCGVTHHVDASTNKYDLCPSECAFFAQNKQDDSHCSFVCAPANECRKWNPKTPMADSMKQSRTCRGPRVSFCRELSLDGTDSCRVCQSGFRVFEEDGQCYFAYWKTGVFIGFLIITPIVVLISWFVHLCLRPTINQGEVDRAITYRERSKLQQPKTAEGHRHQWPLMTNLCTTDVAGLGMVLHFNFQAFCIVWPLVVALMWCSLAAFHEELWILGTRRFGTPRHNCILVAWGYETQHRLMWTKVLFLVMVYIFSFVSFLLFSVRQYRIYQRMNAQETTMQDVALELRGLPSLPGVATVESDLKDLVEKATGVEIVGVSVAWIYGQSDAAVAEMSDAIDDAIRRDLDSDQQARLNSGLSPRTDSPDDPTLDLSAMSKKMYELESAAFGPDGEDEDLDEEQKQHKEKEQDEIWKRKLKDMVTSDTAFVVFKTGSDAKHALEKTKGGIKFTHIQDHTLTLEAVSYEPRAVNWQNFGNLSGPLMTRRLLSGFFKVYLPTLMGWFFFIYLPYAVAVYRFNYENGAEVPFYYNMIFTIIVAIGNVTMYFVCDVCSEGIGFRQKDTKACCYTIMYLAACTINVLLDMVVTYSTALRIMIGLGFRTYQGVPLEKIDTFSEQFETYAMQRSLGENSYSYAFPSTFLIPFLAEPIATVLIPYQIGRLIVRTHSEIQGSLAESYMAALDFDLGRYADLLLNLFLGILIFWFPGGYTWTLFFGMAISHLYIYAFDHWRVLNVIPTIQLDSYNIDWCAQACLAACCGLILSALVFKTNCADGVNVYCVGDGTLFAMTVSAGVGHTIVHLLLLIYLVPTLGVSEAELAASENGDAIYADIAKVEANSWFSVNPVHCLRSKLVHKHEPHCRLATTGKEHFLKINESIGCYFEDDAATPSKEPTEAKSALGHLAQKLNQS